LIKKKILKKSKLDEEEDVSFDGEYEETESEEEELSEEDE
jgi:hypothetical protein